MTPPAAKVPVSVYCVNLDVPEAHARCGAAGPMYLPGVLPAGVPAMRQIACGCACHGKGKSR